MRVDLVHFSSFGSRVVGFQLSAFSCQLSAVKCEGPARTPDLSVFDCLLLNCNEWSNTHLYFWEKFDLVWMVDCGRVLHRDRGLTGFWVVPVVSGRQAHISKARCGAPGAVGRRRGVRLARAFSAQFAGGSGQ